MTSEALPEARRASTGSSIGKSHAGFKQEDASGLLNELPAPNVTAKTGKFWDKLGAHDGLETKRAMKSRHLVMIGELIFSVSVLDSDLISPSHWRNDWYWHFPERRIRM